LKRACRSAPPRTAELAYFLDLDGNLLITNDPFAGVTARNGMISFSTAPEKSWLCVRPRG
jgi:hypothetical protein